MGWACVLVSVSEQRRDVARLQGEREIHLAFIWHFPRRKLYKQTLFILQKHISGTCWPRREERANRLNKYGKRTKLRNDEKRRHFLEQAWKSLRQRHLNLKTFRKDLEQHVKRVFVVLHFYPRISFLFCFTSDSWDLRSGGVESAEADEDDDDDGGDDDEEEDDDGDPGLVSLPAGLVRLLQAVPSHQTHPRFKLILQMVMLLKLVVVLMVLMMVMLVLTFAMPCIFMIIEKLQSLTLSCWLSLVPTWLRSTRLFARLPPLQ